MIGAALALLVALGAPSPADLLRRVLGAPAAGARVEVSAPWPGASPLEVEGRLLRPIEAALLAVRGGGRVEATARSGEARLVVFGAPGVDGHSLLGAMSDALAAAGHAWPEGAERPVLRLRPAGLVQLSWVGRLDPVALRRVPGVHAVEPCAEVPRVVVRVDPRRLRAFGLGLAAVARALQVPAQPAPAASARLLVRVADETGDLETLTRSIVQARPDGTLVKLSDIATARVEPGPRSCACHRAGERAPCGVAWVTAEALEPARAAALGAGAREAGPTVTVEAVGGAPSIARRPGFLFRVRGQTVAVLAPAADEALLSALDTIPGVTWRPPDPVATLCVAGPDRGPLRALAATVLTRLGRGEGRVLARTSGPDEPSLVVEPDPRRLAALGLTRRVVDDAVAASTSGLWIGRRQRGGQSLDLLLQLGEGAASPQSAVEALRHVVLGTPQGADVPLASVATVQLEASRPALERCDGRPGVLIDVWGQAPDLADLARNIELPLGYTIEASPL